jgi:hypothetical protein
MLRFFLSYAHADDADLGLVKRFYDDLCLYVGGKVGEPANSVGYLDKFELRLGQEWSEELKGALQRCRAFLPLMSASYWKSEWCGAEWAFFEQRCAAQANPPPKLIAPINWITPFEGEHPDFATALQFAPPQNRLPADVQKLFEQRYGQDGMSWFVKFRGKESDDLYRAYQSLVAAIGDGILTLAKTQPLDPYAGPPLPPLASMPKRFAAPAVTPGGAGSIAPNSRRAYFAVVAGRAAEMGEARPQGQHRYGAAAVDDFVPFGAEPKPIALIAQQIASALGLVHTPLSPAQGWIQALRTAEDEHNPTIVVIDPWTAKLPAYRARLVELDTAQFINCAVIVVWDAASGEDSDVPRDTLWPLLSRRRINTRPPLLCEDVTDPVKLHAALTAALSQIDTNLAAFRPVVRLVQSGVFAQRPGLSAT